jgi:hypothetical protein
MNKATSSFVPVPLPAQDRGAGLAASAGAGGRAPDAEPTLNLTRSTDPRFERCALHAPAVPA